jgi:RNA-binding protein 26
MDMEVNNPMEMRPPKSYNNGFRPPVRGGGRSRGTFGGEIHNFRPERRNDKTLVVEKIPEDKLTLEQVNEWFKRFGTVTNVAIDSSNAKALISFSNHEEAHAAWKSEDAVFNNRFVKVFWHRPMEGHGQVGARMLAASAPLVANISAKESSARPAAPPSLSSSATERKPSSIPSAAASALAAKQQLLEQQIAEQKSLMASLDNASPDEKKAIMARLRKLGEEMDPMAVTAQASSSSAPTKKPGSSSSKGEDREKKERERLDKELEMHSATAAVDGEESTEDLKAKLERLKAEVRVAQLSRSELNLTYLQAASLGIAETEPSFGSSYRTHRGRGRGGRGFHRSIRGGPPRGSMKLDNRPKKLLVKGVRTENVQALRDWFEVYHASRLVV